MGPKGHGWSKKKTIFIAHLLKVSHAKWLDCFSAQLLWVYYAIYLFSVGWRSDGPLSRTQKIVGHCLLSSRKRGGVHTCTSKQNSLRTYLDLIFLSEWHKPLCLVSALCFSGSATDLLSPHISQCWSPSALVPRQFLLPSKQTWNRKKPIGSFGQNLSHLLSSPSLAPCLSLSAWFVWKKKKKKQSSYSPHSKTVPRPISKGHEDQRVTRSFSFPVRIWKYKLI